MCLPVCKTVTFFSIVTVVPPVLLLCFEEILERLNQCLVYFHDTMVRVELHKKKKPIQRRFRFYFCIRIQTVFVFAPPFTCQSLVSAYSRMSSFVTTRRDLVFSPLVSKKEDE
ncbi:hypothetical protein RRG08_044448 [Elysia crispata]|uniref:Uncharacterized protein n=1 Tax=Elysia crispata TaxID=231223 RepID=A0AAE1CRP4_9GAST|nr:hypothetical protein RRG08_044448 [Elysia crispata]